MIRALFIVIFSCTLMVSTCDPVHGQFQQELYQLKSDSLYPEGELRLSLRGAGFFNNNEFFGGSVKGYTLTGSFFQPSLHYSFSRNLSVETGLHLLKYNGQENFKRISPFFSINYKPVEEVEIRAGSFVKGANLGLPEPLLKFENQFADLIGNGIMISNRLENWTSVTWLDWLVFIEPGDPFREEFIFGHSSHLKLIEKPWGRIEIPLYLLARHKGGQINDNDEAIETRSDLGGGLQYQRFLNTRLFQNLKILGNLYFEAGPEDFNDGNASLVYSEFTGEIFSFGFGYFYQKNWESILGEPLLFSYREEGVTGDQHNQLFLFKAGLGKRITDTSSLMIRFEGYYDTNLGRLQYTYGLHIMLNEWISVYNFRK